MPAGSTENISMTVWRPARSFTNTTGAMPPRRSAARSTSSRWRWTRRPWRPGTCASTTRLTTPCLSGRTWPPSWRLRPALLCRGADRPARLGEHERQARPGRDGHHGRPEKVKAGAQAATSPMPLRQRSTRGRTPPPFGARHDPLHGVPEQFVSEFPHNSPCKISILIILP